MSVIHPAYLVLKEQPAEFLALLRVNLAYKDTTHQLLDHHPVFLVHQELLRLVRHKRHVINVWQEHSHFLDGVVVPYVLQGLSP